MTTRRATYSPGKGLLFVDRDRLLFVTAADHVALPALAAAARGDRALRSLAAAVVGADFEVPPFVFVQQGEDLRGMVFGAIELELADPDSSFVRGDVDDSWSYFRGSSKGVVSVGGGVPASMWVEVGFVYADAFRWVAAEATAPRLTLSIATALVGEVGNNAADAAAETLSDAEGDPTIVTSQPFEACAVPLAEPRTDLSVYREAEGTIDPATGEEPFEGSRPPRTVDARVCLNCRHPNPPREVHCRACSASIAQAGGEIRVVAQPTLGILHLSGGRVESLDMDLLIGRNPAREQLEPHQRAVVHGQGDRSVSRRHIDLRLDGWQVVVTNLKGDEHTTRESRHGDETALRLGASQSLEVGDTVRYGGSWFRYEEGP